MQFSQPLDQLRLLSPLPDKRNTQTQPEPTCAYLIEGAASPCQCQLYLSSHKLFLGFSISVAMEKLLPNAASIVAKMAAIDLPVLPILGDPTEPAVPEERASWKNQSDYLVKVLDLYADESGNRNVEKYIDNTELFSYPSEDGTYTIESRFFRAEGENPPLVVHFHGGAMTLCHRDMAYEMNTCQILRKMGCSVLTPEFRNASEYPFPAGVDDCLSTVKWAHANRELLGFGDAVITSGGSGGGNLSIAAFVRALEKEGPNAARELIHGIFSDAPLIRSSYVGVEKIEAVTFSPITSPSSNLQLICNNYTQNPDDAQNPSAWPLLASDEMLKNFPPTCLRGEELCALREDAKELYGRLSDLGVEGCTYAERKNQIHIQWMGPAIAIGDIDAFLAIGEIGQFAKSIALMRVFKIGKNKFY